MVLFALLKQIKNFPTAGLINDKEFHTLLLQTEGNRKLYAKVC